MSQSLEAQMATISGAWKLVRYELFKEGDETTPMKKPHGDVPFGYCIFTPDGYMNGTLTPPACALPLETAEWSQASDEDVLRVARGMTTYTGPFKLYEEGGRLRLHCRVDIAMNPNWIGEAQRRDVQFEESNGHTYMTLRPLKYFPMQDGTNALGVLKWEKMGKADL